MLQVKVKYGRIKSSYGWGFQWFAYLVNYVSLRQLLSQLIINKFVNQLLINQLLLPCAMFHIWKWFVWSIKLFNNGGIIFFKTTKSNRTFLQAHARLRSLFLHVKISYGFGISIVYMIFRDVLRILWNIYDGAFSENK